MLKSDSIVSFDSRPVAVQSETQAVAAPKVLLVESCNWACAHRLAIVLSNAGFEVSAVCPAYKHPLQKSRAVRRILPYSTIRPLRSLAIAIEATDPQIVIPCDDLAVQHLHQLHERALKLEKSAPGMAALIEQSLGSPESYPIVSSRWGLLKIAREEGLRVPDTCQVNTMNDLKSWQADHVPPWVLKSDRTWGGRGVKIAQTSDQVEPSFREMTRLFRDVRAIKRLIIDGDPMWIRPWRNRSRPAIVVQQYVYGCPANCAVVSWKGRILAGISVEAVSTRGPIGPATVVRVVDNPAMMLCAKRIAYRLGLSGFFGLDFVIEAGSGATFLIEMNPRGTPLSHLQLGKGRDLSEALCSQMTGQPLRDKPPVTQNDMIAYFPEAWACQSEYLDASFHDIPQGEPELVEELLRLGSVGRVPTRVSDSVLFQIHKTRHTLNRMRTLFQRPD
ncbi:MAG TPA: ATP-grasp domain-containing protein [Terriglobales bacterium]|nr:ATP-grasp domain-containing protein [Terriglobales bacterium]